MANLNQDPGYEELMVLDDGTFYMVIAMSAAQADEHAPAYLMKRERGNAIGIGSCFIGLDCSWHTRLSVAYDGESDSDSVHLGDFDNRTDAIVRLWQRRHEASYLPQGI